MKVLIVAKTRRGAGACVGRITESGQSVRLIAQDASTNAQAGLQYNIGEVWEIEAAPDPDACAPHVENIIVLDAQRLRLSHKVEETIERFMPPVCGGPECLFDRLTQPTPVGALYVAERTGLPQRSTMFWRPDQPLQLDCESKRIRYRYETPMGGRTLVFVGFQEPLAVIPAGTLLRVSLAHPWRPPERPEEELRCFMQLSGWFLKASASKVEAAPSVLDLFNRQSAAVACLENRAPGSSVDAPASPPSLSAALIVLKQTFGFSEFLPVQADVIRRVLGRRDSLVVMPTGGGKSLCYQLPALLFDGLTVVVSPLVALMQDQVRQLEELGVPAACLNHMVSLPEWTAIAHGVRNGAIRILYLAPETLLRPETLILLEESKLTCLAVDEAHCISEWGHDFRPEYRQLRQLRERFSRAVCIALTATATGRVREDIRRSLGIPSEGEFVASFNRPNLMLEVEARRDALAQVLTFLESRRGQSGIIYCGTRKQVDELCGSLNANGWVALPYHAGLDNHVRRRNQDRFIKDDVPIMVATVAFGMGINKSNVSFVIHAHLPKDLESYYQEIGRAGRDGLPAHCLLLYSRGDAVVHRRFIDEGAPSERPGRQARLEALMRFAEVRECRRVPLLAYFGETFEPPCGHCDSCLRQPDSGERLDVSEAARTFLTCVETTGQLFGAAHIIAVLRGSKAERVLAKGHDQLPIFGAGKACSVEGWRELVRQFLHLGLIEQDLEFGGLRITDKGQAVLHGQDKVLVPIEHGPAASQSELQPAEEDPELFARLRSLRKKLADEARLPAYMIFSDRALVDMAARRPQTEGQFLAISGVGQAKLSKYGQPFLHAIREYCVEQGLPVGEASAASPAQAIVRPVTRRRCHEVGELFAAGQSVEAIAKQYNVTLDTVILNLQKFVEDGGRLDASRLLDSSALPEKERGQVLSAFERLGLERLAPVYEACAGKISYNELRGLRLYLLCR